ncbi:hypothetical protein, partial [Collimonas silvisoli]|uniref:hypothetical protein n=1 Tax=Collimonas silvisoli TaxID=2825884 RepID=UPI001B8B3F48
MKKYFLTLEIFQLLLIIASGYLRQNSWIEIDFLTGPISSTLKTSFYLFLCWFATIFIAICIAIKDTKHRAMIILFFVILFPFFEFF